ncbi:Galactose mutarotase-like domain-containing protein [Artemisia annua]|uniref:Galactose mutarotase-like domain-containing protein n=1 Tax=Artemisia annua TaxID=35608 RepID=A0A2U1L9R7_ARTAN|nr:Galactose mutarotase-like domain-containing protein [Artemisia annua]
MELFKFRKYHKSFLDWETLKARMTASDRKVVIAALDKIKEAVPTTDIQPSSVLPALILGPPVVQDENDICTSEDWKSSLAGKDKEDPSGSLVFFMRAGFRNCPKWAMLFWEGDQMVSWQANDGKESSVVGLPSSGLCGYAFNHSDIGCYSVVNLPRFKYNRDEELLLRWMEQNAFTTIFRTHEPTHTGYLQFGDRNHAIVYQKENNLFVHMVVFLVNGWSIRFQQTSFGINLWATLLDNMASCCFLYITGFMWFCNNFYNSSKKRKEYLVLTCGHPFVNTMTPSAKGEDDDDQSSKQSVICSTL